MRWLLITTLAIAAPAWSQIEATDPATGILMTAKLLVNGKLLAAGQPRAELGQVKVLMKPRQTSSTVLLRDLESAAQLQRHVDMEISMRAVRTGAQIPAPAETFDRVAPAFERLVAAKCGVCQIELVEQPLGKGETLRIVLIEGLVAALILDKSRNAYRADLYKPWTGRRLILQGDSATRLTQSPGSFQVEPLDLDTGAPQKP